jgi:hypothetical protein
MDQLKNHASVLMLQQKGTDFIFGGIDMTAF